MSRQFRSDDTSRWNETFGSSQNGALTISSNTTESPIDATCTGSASATTLSATNGSFSGGQAIFIHQTQGTGVGSWELNRIISYSSGTIILEYPLINTYGTGAQVYVMSQYSSFTLNSGISYTPKSWNGSTGGILAFLCSGTTNIVGTIQANGYNASLTGSGPGGGATLGGYFGGNGYTTNGAVQTWAGEGDVGHSTQVANAGRNGTGGGGAAVASGAGTRRAGGGGGNGTTGGGGSGGSGTQNGQGGNSNGNTNLTQMLFGGGGGGGANGDFTNYAGGGGSGGEIVLIISQNITITGGINLNGGNGATATINADGGGAAGGSCLIKAQTATLGSNLITATGGTSPSFSGGVGRIHIDYLTSFTGSTNPSIDSRQDTSLYAINGGGFLFSLL